MYPFKTVRGNKGDVAKREGVWLGTIERIEDAIIGTPNGVTKCRTVTRLLENQRWNADNVSKMRGVPLEPIFGRGNSLIPVDVEDHGETIESEERESIPYEEDGENARHEPTFRGGFDKLHISRKAVNKYGTTDGCPACEAIKRRGHLPGRLGHNHSQVCRERLMEAMREDPYYNQLVRRHQQLAIEGSVPNVEPNDPI